MSTPIRRPKTMQCRVWRRSQPHRKQGLQGPGRGPSPTMYSTGSSAVPSARTSSPVASSRTVSASIAVSPSFGRNQPSPYTAVPR